MSDLTDKLKNLIIEPSYLQPEGHDSMTFVFIAPHGVPHTRFLDSATYGKAVRDLQKCANSVIRIICPEQYYLEVLIRSVTPYGIKVSQLNLVDLYETDVIDADLPANHSVYFAGVPQLWVVTRGDQVLRDEFPDKQSAMQYARELASAA